MGSCCILSIWVDNIDWAIIICVWRASCVESIDLEKSSILLIWVDISISINIDIKHQVTVILIIRHIDDLAGSLSVLKH